MSPLIILAAIAGIPLLLLIVLRIKPLYAFVSIVTGYFWAQFLGETAELLLNSFVRIANPGIVIRLVLLLLPFILTLLFMRKTLSASALPFQFILLVANSLLLATFIVPMLTTGTQGAIYQTEVGSIFNKAHDVLIAAVAGLHLLVMYLMRPRHSEKHSGKHHK